MIPLQPDLHCFHIGYGHRPDANGGFKCNDELECGIPADTDEPALLQLTPNATIQACIAASNAVVAEPGFQFPFTNVCQGSGSGRRLFSETAVSTTEKVAAAVGLRGAK